MRNAMLISAMLSNSETLYGLTKHEVEELEAVDEHLLRKILSAHSKTPKELLYLETATIPIRFILKARRLGYLHHILTRNSTELINRVYCAQKRRPVRYD